MIELDAIDRKILGLLQGDCRLTMQEIADRVGLSASPVGSAIARAVGAVVG